MKTKFLLTAFTSFWVLFCYGQTLDQKAYNHVWDKLEVMYSDISTDEEIITVPKSFRLATWGDDNASALRDLARFASILPKNEFQIDPDDTQERLDQVYETIAKSVKVKAKSPEDQAKLEAIKLNLEKALTDEKEKRKAFELEWQAHVTTLSEGQKEFLTQERANFENIWGGEVALAYSKVLDFYQQMAAYLGPNDIYGKAVAQLIAQKDVSLAFKRSGEYYTNFIALRAMKDKTCSPKDLSEISLTSDTKSTNIRTKGWNGNGSWDKKFFKIGVGANSSNYSYFFQGENTSISLKFCNPLFVEVYPGGWFNTTFLRALDEGRIEYKDDSPNKGKAIFGPNGMIPRMMKGVLVASRVEFEAVLDEEQLNQVKSSKSGSGGLKIGPFKIGGGASKVKFDEKKTDDTGKYRLVADLGYPVIFAVITQNTKRNLEE